MPALCRADFTVYDAAKEYKWHIVLPCSKQEVTIELTTRSIYIGDYRLPIGTPINRVEAMGRWMAVYTDDTTELVDIRTKEVRIMSDSSSPSKTCEINLSAQRATWPALDKTLTFRDITEMNSLYLPYDTKQ